MILGRSLKVLTTLIALLMVATATAAWATTSSLSVASTSLGKIVVNGKGFTAYFFDLDQANSGVSACIGGCAIKWPAIISKTSKVRVFGITGKVTVLPHTNQIAINGRPIYTFAGDSVKGDTNGQGLGGVWYVISAKGAEVKPTTPTNANGSSTSPTPTASASSSPTPAATPSPTVSASASTYTNSNY